MAAESSAPAAPPKPSQDRLNAAQPSQEQGVERTEVSLTDDSVMAEPPRALKVRAFGITDKGKVRPANEGGASDNITLLIVRFDEAAAADVPTARVEPVAAEVVKRQ